MTTQIIFTQEHLDMLPKSYKSKENDRNGVKYYTITQRSDGRYMCSIPVAYEFINGKKKYLQHAVYGKDEQEVIINRYDYISGVIADQNGEKDYNAMFSTAVERWLYDTKQGTIKNNSFDRLEGIYLHQILPVVHQMKHQKLTEVDESDLNIIMRSVLNKGYSYSTILKVYRFLGEFFKYHTMRGTILKNPHTFVKMYKEDFVHSNQNELREEREQLKIRVKEEESLTADELALALSTLKMQDKTEVRILTDDEIASLKDAAQKKFGNGKPRLKQAQYFIFLLNTGLRSGEALALSYSDFDYEHNTLRIRKSVSLSKKRGNDGRTLAKGGYTQGAGSTKSDYSETVLPINQTAINIIKELQRNEPHGYNGYIIHNEKGRFINKRGFEKRWHNLCRLANIEQCGMHALRHTFASKIFELTGGDSKMASELLRHADVSFTQKTYIHLQQKFKQSFVQTIQI